MKIDSWKPLLLILSACVLTGCFNSRTGEAEITPNREQAEERELEKESAPVEESEEKPEEKSAQEQPVSEPEIIEADWSEYFDGLNGAAVIYDPMNEKYWIYNQELAMTQRSPCSTFKIISSLIALENGILDPENSTREWSGEVFWNEDWNRDLNFEEAFRGSCVWYFRELTDEIGSERMQEGLDRLAYGNRDISDWEGRLNTNNNNRALTGFWIESSLAVSPKEQTEVMERIFGENSLYSEKTREALRQVMRVEETETEFSVYGKTGMGKAQGVVVDAWFAGFAEHARGTVYFCVYLGKTDGGNVSSTAAKEMAIRLVSDFYAS